MGKGKEGGDLYPVKVISLSEPHWDRAGPVSMGPGLRRNQAVTLLPTSLK